MSVLFDDGSNEYLQAGTPDVVTTPLTIGGWFKSDKLTALESILHICDASNTSRWFALAVSGDVNNAINAYARNSGSIGEAEGSACSLNTWQYGLAIFEHITLRSSILGKQAPVTNTVSVVDPPALDRVSIGRFGDSSAGQYWSGPLAELTIWQGVLPLQDRIDAANGLWAKLISPTTIKHHWSLRDLVSGLKDGVGSLDMTAFNTPTSTPDDHPEIHYARPRRKRSGFLSTGGHRR